MIRPVFVDGCLCAFTCNRAHQSDIGGGAAGTYNPEATEIFHEGIRMPVLKLVEGGRLRKDLFRLLLLNSRCLNLMEGDLGAMFRSTRIGTERVAAMLAELGVDAGAAYFDALLHYAEARMRAEVAKLPAGTYRGEDGSDTDCFTKVDVPVRVALEVRGDELVFNFTDSAPQIAGFKNSSLANTYSVVYVVVASFFDHSLPRNEGLFRPVRIVAPEDIVVNARPPALMTMNTVYPPTDIIHACWKALAQALPERACAGWGKARYGISSGRDGDGRFFVMYHWHGSSGSGAVKGRDGFQCIGLMISLGGLTLPNVEGYEQTYPVRILQQEFRRDTAGTGRFHGGRGSTTPAASSCRASTRFGPSRIHVQSSAGGGWGDPRKRDPEAVLADVLEEIISVEAAREIYRVALTPDARAMDLEETARIRRR